MFAHEDGGPEPDWVRTERDQFSDFRDLNKDGKMDQDEIRHWIMPQDYDHAQAEARHLVYESDQDKVRLFSRCEMFLNLSKRFTHSFLSHQDQKLTKQEILDNWNMFVGSQATNYGEDLTRNHDELWSLKMFVSYNTDTPIELDQRNRLYKDASQIGDGPTKISWDCVLLLLWIVLLLTFRNETREVLDFLVIGAFQL